MFFLGQTYKKWVKLVKTVKNLKKHISKNGHQGGRKNEKFQKIRSYSKRKMKTALEGLFSNLKSVKNCDFLRRFCPRHPLKVEKI